MVISSDLIDLSKSLKAATGEMRANTAKDLYEAVIVTIGYLFHVSLIFQKTVVGSLGTP